MTVKEAIEKIIDDVRYEERVKRMVGVWVCPHISYSTKITPRPYEQGYEFANWKNIPEYILNQKVRKYKGKSRLWFEDDVLCIVWQNNDVIKEVEVGE